VCEYFSGPFCVEILPPGSGHPKTIVIVPLGVRRPVGLLFFRFCALNPVVVRVFTWPAESRDPLALADSKRLPSACRTAFTVGEALARGRDAPRIRPAPFDPLSRGPDLFPFAGAAPQGGLAGFDAHVHSGKTIFANLNGFDTQISRGA